MPSIKLLRYTTNATPGALEKLSAYIDSYRSNLLAQYAKTGTALQQAIYYYYNSKILEKFQMVFKCLRVPDFGY